MRAVIREIPDRWVEERARLGLDHHDEMWDGVLHIVPPPSLRHQDLGSALLAFLRPLLATRGLKVVYEAGVFRPDSDDKDYRVPDLVFFPADRPDLVSERGLIGAPTAVLEIRSPDDATYDKFDFWATVGVAEVIVVVPETRAVEVFRLAGPRYVATSADEQGRVHAASIDVRFTRVTAADAAPPRLRVEVHGSSIEV